MFRRMNSVFLQLLAVLVVFQCRRGLSASSTFRLSTFNTNLLRQVSYFYPERKAAIISAFNASATDTAGTFLRNSDILCLQEVAEIGDVKALREAARQTYRYSMSALDKRFPEDVGADLSEGACGSDFKIIAACVSEECAKFLNESGPSSKLLMVCALQSPCGLQNLSQTCINCLTALGFGKTKRCSMESKETWRTTHGLLLLSRFPLSETKAVSYRQVSTFHSRGYLSVEVDLSGEKFKVICAHSYPVMVSQAYAGPFQTSAQENLNETSQILSETSSSKNSIILGDLNTSPELSSSSVHAAHLDSYNGLSAAKYTNAYISKVGKCTFCPSNWLNKLVNKTDEEILDHVLLRLESNLSATTTAERVGDKPAVTAKISTLEVPSPLSDHYGVTAYMTLTGSRSAGFTSRPIPLSGVLGVVMAYSLLLLLGFHWCHF